MSGTTSRRRGHRFEQQLGRWFSQHGLGDVTSSRNLSGGRQAGTDLATRTDHGFTPGVNGWCIEAKDQERPAVTGWLQQAADDANGLPHAVIHKNRQHPLEQAYVYLPACWAEPLLDLTLPPDIRRVTVDLAVFTAALTRWET